MAKKLPKIISREEYEKLLKEAPKVKRVTAKTKREYILAMILGGEAGLRISEIVGLRESISRCCMSSLINKREQVGDKKIKVKYCGKCEKKLGEKDTIKSKTDWGIKPLTKDKINLQAHTIFVEAGKGQKDGIVPVPLRFTERHLKMLPLKIQRRALQHFITKLGKDVLDKEISFHTMRHYFGSQCAERMPLHEVQMLLRHSRLDTTGIYLHANPKQAVEAARKVFEE